MKKGEAELIHGSPSLLQNNLSYCRSFTFISFSHDQKKLANKMRIEYNLSVTFCGCFHLSTSHCSPQRIPHASSKSAKCCQRLREIEWAQKLGSLTGEQSCSICSLGLLVPSLRFPVLLLSMSWSYWGHLGCGKWTSEFSLLCPPQSGA